MISQIHSSNNKQNDSFKIKLVNLKILILLNIVFTNHSGRRNLHRRGMRPHVRSKTRPARD